MKLPTHNRSVIQSNPNFKSKEFAIKASDSPVIMEMLRSKIYSNKPAAVVREYTTNALDEHKAHNITKLPTISAPTVQNPEFKVRDYAFGLTPNEIEEIYINYGCSTKRDSNDLTGGLGIGCKAGFAYGDQFTITSWTLNPETMNIDKHIYAAVIDESNVGTLKHMGHTELPAQSGITGIEIGMAVDTDDVTRFQQEITNLRLTSAMPFEIINENRAQLKAEYRIITEEYRRLNIDTASDSYYKYNTGIVIMGNIGYPISTSLLTCNQLGKDLASDKTIQLLFNVGELSIASNREELEYNKETITLLSSRLENIANKLIKEVTSKVLSSKCFIDRVATYAELAKDLSYSLKRAVNDTLPSEITSYYLTPNSNRTTFVHYYYKDVGGVDKLFADRNHRGTISWNKRDANVVFGFVDKDIAPAQLTRRVKSMIAKLGLNTDYDIFIWEKNQNTTVQGAFQDTGLPFVATDKLVNVTDYEPLKAKKGVTKGSTAHVDLFKFNRQSYGTTDTWKDAGSVSISVTDPLFFAHLSGHRAVFPEYLTCETERTRSTLQLDKRNIKDILMAITLYVKYLPKDLQDVIKPYLDVKGNWNYKVFNLYGSRKNNYKFLETRPNTYNIIEIAKTAVTNARNTLGRQDNELGDYIEYQRQLSESHGKQKLQLNDDGALGWRGTWSSGSGVFLKLNRLPKNIKTVLKKDKDLARMLYLTSLGTDKIQRLLEDIDLLQLSFTPSSIKSSIELSEVKTLLNKIMTRWPLLSTLLYHLNIAGEEHDLFPDKRHQILYGLADIPNDQVNRSKIRKNIKDYNKKMYEHLLDYISLYKV